MISRFYGDIGGGVLISNCRDTNLLKVKTPFKLSSLASCAPIYGSQSVFAGMKALVAESW